MISFRLIPLCYALCTGVLYYSFVYLCILALVSYFYWVMGMHVTTRKTSLVGVFCTRAFHGLGGLAHIDFSKSFACLLRA